jgi:hypothetical protein
MAEPYLSPGSAATVDLPEATSARPATDLAASYAERSLERWQNRLLPFLMWLVAGVTSFFLVATLFQLNALQRRIESPPTLDLTPALSGLQSSSSSADRLLFAQWQTLARLEQNALERRYHQANVLLMSRTWTRYLGFITGMIMAMVGAAFILGKLREEASTLALKTPTAEANLNSTSPGLVLCLLGTVLMLSTLLTHNDIETQDAPLYTNVVVSGGTAAAPPARLPGGNAEPRPEGSVPDPLGEPQLP